MLWQESSENGLLGKGILIMKKDNCIFCKIINGDIPSRRLYEDDNFIVMMDIQPASKGHSLVLPKEHYANLFEMPEELAGEAIKVAQKMVKKMAPALHADGFNLLQNNGEAAGQTVSHFHIHLIPRYKGEAEILNFTPQDMTGEELDAIKDMIL